MGSKKQKRLAKKVSQQSTAMKFICAGKIESAFEQTIVVKFHVDYIPKFEAILCLKNQIPVAKVCDNFHIMRNYKVVAKLLQTLNISQFSSGTEVYISEDFLIPINKFIPPDMRGGDHVQKQLTDEKKNKSIVQNVASDSEDVQPPQKEDPLPQKALNVQAEVPPSNTRSRKKRVRGTLIATTLPVILPITGIIPKTSNRNEENQKPQIRYSKSDSSMKTSQPKPTEHRAEATAAVLKLQSQAKTETKTPAKTQHFASIENNPIRIDNPQRSQGLTEANIIYNLAEQRARNRDTNSDQPRPRRGYAIRGRSYSQPPSQDNTSEYSQYSHGDNNQGLPTATGGIEASTSQEAHGTQGWPYIPPGIYPLNQTLYYHSMNDQNNSRNLRQDFYQPPAGNNDENWPSLNYQQRLPNVTARNGRADRCERSTFPGLQQDIFSVGTERENENSFTISGSDLLQDNSPVRRGGDSDYNLRGYDPGLYHGVQPDSFPVGSRRETEDNIRPSLYNDLQQNSFLGRSESGNDTYFRMSDGGLHYGLLQNSHPVQGGYETEYNFPGNDGGMYYGFQQDNFADQSRRATGNNFWSNGNGLYSGLLQYNVPVQTGNEDSFHTNGRYVYPGLQRGNMTEEMYYALLEQERILDENLIRIAKELLAIITEENEV